MSDLTKPFDIKGKYNPLDVIAFPMAVETIYRGVAIGYVKGTGYAKGLAYDSAPPERFLGISLETISNTGSAGDKSVKVARKGLFLFNGGGSLVAADVGKRVYFTDDNTISTTVGNVFAGRLEVVDAEGAWVRIDEATEKNVTLRPVVMQPQTLGAAGTARRVGYVVPAGAVAFLVKGDYGYSVKPNFGTSATLALNKVSTTTRTTLLSTATIDVNNTTPAVDVPTALTLTLTTADLKMVAGDRLEATVVGGGSFTAGGDTFVAAEVLEIGGSND